MLGPHQSPIYLTRISLTNSIILELWKFILAYVKSRETKSHLKTRVELKLFKRKLDFWKLFENWSLENYLKIEFLKNK